MLWAKDDLGMSKSVVMNKLLARIVIIGLLAYIFYSASAFAAEGRSDFKVAFTEPCSGGLFLEDVTINNITGNAYLDTGAERGTVKHSWAVKHGIALGRKKKVRSLSGVLVAHRFKPKSVQLSSQSVKPRKMMVMPREINWQYDFVISSLQFGSSTYNFNRRDVTSGNSLQDKGTPLKIRHLASIPSFHSRIGDLKLVIGIDTGANRSMMDIGFAQQLISTLPKEEFEAEYVLTTNGRILSKLKIKEVRSADFLFENMTFEIVDNPEVRINKRRALLGLDNIVQYNWYIDHYEVIRVERNGRDAKPVKSLGLRLKFSNTKPPGPAIVYAIAENGRAYAMGVRLEDVITKINGIDYTMKNAQKIVNMTKCSLDQNIEISVRRKGEYIEYGTGR